VAPAYPERLGPGCRCLAHREVALHHLNIAYVALTEDRIADAHASLRPGFVAAERLSLRGWHISLFGNLGLAHLFDDDRPRAQEAFQTMLELSAETRYLTEVGAAAAMGFPGPSDAAIHGRIDRDFIAPVRDRSDPSVWERAGDHGRTLSYEQAISYALSQLATIAPDAPTPLRASPCDATRASATHI
jgi:hypothetical protein